MVSAGLLLDRRIAVVPPDRAWVRVEPQMMSERTRTPVGARQAACGASSGIALPQGQLVTDRRARGLYALSERLRAGLARVGRRGDRPTLPCTGALGHESSPSPGELNNIYFLHVLPA